MTGYERASDKGESKTTVTFWAELWWPMQKNSHGEALISPKFGTEPECIAWVRARRTEERNGTTPQVGMWRRTSHAGRDYEDTPLYTEDAPRVAPEKIRGLVEDMQRLLTKPI